MLNKLPQDLTETCLSSQVAHSGQILKLTVDEVRLPDGKTSKREVVHHPGGVVIIPITADGKFVLVEQYRYAIGQHLLEFPAGRLNYGEVEPEKAAARELTEETGYLAERLESLDKIFSAPGFCDERLYVYLATGLQEGVAKPDEDEFVRTVHLSKQELAQMIAAGKIQDAKTLACWGMVLGRGLA